MCVGVKVEDQLCGKNHFSMGKLSVDKETQMVKPKRRNNEERKEKAKDAARNRRTEESDYFEELDKLLPVTGPPPSSQQTSLDKTSIIRLSVAHLKIKDVLQNGLYNPFVKEEIFSDIDLLSCLDGFNLVLSSHGDIIYISDNVNQYIGLSQVELLGQDFSEYVHPCDHNQLKQLRPNRIEEGENDLVEIFVRVKCTVTERGRMINLKQANYKPLKISGQVRYIKEKEIGGLSGTIFMGLATCVIEREVMVDCQKGVFTSKHSVDMKFMDTSQWMASEAGYSSAKLMGVSFFELVHAHDSEAVLKAFKNLKEHGQCETPPYRLLCFGGGYLWLQTKACLTTARRGCSKGQTVSCRHQQISEVMNKEEILSIIQMKGQTGSTSTSIQVKSDPVTLRETKSYQEAAEASVQFDIIQAPIANQIVEIPKVQKSVIIEPRQIRSNTHSTIISSQFENKVESTPTSVIVKINQNNDAFNPVPLFEEPLDISVKEEDQPMKPATECLWKKEEAVSIATNSIFCNKEPEFPTVPEDFINLFPAKPIQEDIQVELKETELFDDLFTNLEDIEKLAPHCGDQCIMIDKNESEPNAPIIETFSFDDMVMLNFDDDFDFSGKEKDGLAFENQKENPFIEQHVLIDPNRNAMWGYTGQDGDRKKGTEPVLQPEDIIPAYKSWTFDVKEKEDAYGTYSYNLICPELLQEKGKNVKETRNKVFEKNRNVHSIEPPGLIPIRHPKAVKRNLPFSQIELEKQSKKMKYENMGVSSEFENTKALTSQGNPLEINIVTIP